MDRCSKIHLISKQETKNSKLPKIVTITQYTVLQYYIMQIKFNSLLLRISPKTYPMCAKVSALLSDSLSRLCPCWVFASLPVVQAHWSIGTQLLLLWRRSQLVSGWSGLKSSGLEMLCSHWTENSDIALNLFGEVLGRLFHIYKKPICIFRKKMCTVQRSARLSNM